MTKKRIYIISGGTMMHIRPHFSVCAPAYGTVGREMFYELWGAQKRDPAHWRNWNLDELEQPEPDLFDFLLVPLFTRMAKGDDTWGSHPGNFEESTIARSEVMEEAGLKYVDTNEDLSTLVNVLVAREDTRCIIMAAAVCDWEPSNMSQDVVKRYRNYDDPEDGPTTGEEYVSLRGEFLADEFGKDKPRLSSRLEDAPEHRKGLSLSLRAADKIIGRIREERKDIFLVSFKTTAGVSPEETYAAGLRSLKGSSSNLVLANDVQNHHNVVVTPEEFPYHGETRRDALRTLAEMIFDRIQLDFVRTEVLEGEPADLWELDQDDHIPDNFLPVLKHLIERGAYKPLPWSDRTSGHFGCVVTGKDYKRVSSVRKANHNRVMEEGVAKIVSDNGDRIVAMGARPSVGEHTQRMIYEEISRKDWPKLKDGEAASIVHFHCPLRPEAQAPVGDDVWAKEGKRIKSLVFGMMQPPTRPQKPYECGSVQCGTNTAEGMDVADIGVWAVHLEGHGPNIAWSRDADPQRVINYIEKHWDLDQKSGGNLG